MNTKDRNISLFIYGLMAYTIIQFFWWTYLIFELNAEIIELQKVIVNFNSGSDLSNSITSMGNLDAVFAKKKLMILGEAGVFLVILLTGFFLIKRSHDKEIALALQEQNFMLAITHELNSPLAAIKLNIQTMLRRQLDQDKSRMVLNRTAQEAERLHHLINNVLAASRVDNRGYEFYPEKINLVARIAKFVADTEPFFPQDIRLESPGELDVTIDPLAFELILQNLVENASKYSDDNKVIQISLGKEHEYLKLAVADQGIGIPKEEKKNVLNKFYRVGNESIRRSKGTGLGLYLVDNLVSQMKGHLEIADNQPSGSIFIIKIPMS